jgi:hypothetical protein
MKRLASLLIIAFFTFSCNSEKSNQKSDLDASNLKGKVWKIQRTVHKVGNVVCPAAERDNCNQIISIYNKKGNLTESSEVNDNGQVVNISKCIYNGHDECPEISKYSGDKFTGKQLNIFRSGKIIESKVFNKDGEIENIHKYEYSGDELSSGTTLNKAGEVVSSFQNKFFKGQLESQIEKNSTGEISSVTKYKRNIYNDVTESARTFLRDSTEFKPTFDYKYDNQGNWIQQTQLYKGEIAAIIVRNITYYTN